MKFNIILSDTNSGDIVFEDTVDLQYLKDIFPNIILNEGEFWNGSFWKNYQFLLCKSENYYQPYNVSVDKRKIVFITGDEFNWDIVIKQYPDLWNNIFLLKIYKSHRRDIILKSILNKDD